MSEAAERSRAGEDKAGQACGWCNNALTAEDMAAVCAECATIHHELCWDRELGCSKAECLNAPLVKLDAKPKPGAGKIGAGSLGGRQGIGQAPRKKTPGLKPCIGCRQLLQDNAQVCDDCFTVNTPDGLYHGPRTTAPGVREALVISLVGLLFCGPILGPIAIARAIKSREAIRRDPRLDGDGIAVAAIVIGAMDLVLWVFVLFTRVGGRTL
jgi:hypothetical protein